MASCLMTYLRRVDPERNAVLQHGRRARSLRARGPRAALGLGTAGRTREEEHLDEANRAQDEGSTSRTILLQVVQFQINLGDVALHLFGQVFRLGGGIVWSHPEGVEFAFLRFGQV